MKTLSRSEPRGELPGCVVSRQETRTLNCIIQPGPKQAAFMRHSLPSLYASQPAPRASTEEPARRKLSMAPIRMPEQTCAVETVRVDRGDGDCTRCNKIARAGWRSRSAGPPTYLRPISLSSSESTPLSALYFLSSFSRWMCSCW